MRTYTRLTTNPLLQPSSSPYSYSWLCVCISIHPNGKSCSDLGWSACSQWPCCQEGCADILPRQLQLPYRHRRVQRAGVPVPDPHPRAVQPGHPLPPHAGGHLHDAAARLPLPRGCLPLCGRVALEHEYHEIEARLTWSVNARTEALSNEHSCDIESPPPLRVGMRCHTQGKSCSNVGRLLVLTDPCARRSGC